MRGEKDLLRLILNLFEKADNFGYIELDLHGAYPLFEVLGQPSCKGKAPCLSSGLKNLHKIFYTTLDNLCFTNIMARYENEHEPPSAGNFSG
jgi:hypothetical protein